jgi:hypothetical protein
MSEYPSEETLKKIEDWNMTKDNPFELTNFIIEVWNESYGVAELTGKKVKILKLWTGGWSGNEDIIDAIHKSDFWYLYWQQSIRGGFYVFKIRETKNENSDR